MRINNNVTALNTHRMYTNNNANVTKSVAKLSSGYRINSAADDAAGLAISEKMRAQIRGLSMASKNSADAQSMVQTAEGALQETHNILQRMRELAVQSASDTNEQTIDRAALEQEFIQLKTEIDDIASKTRFNDQNLIDGTFQKYTNSVTSATTALGFTGLLVDNSKAGSYEFKAAGVKGTAATSTAGTTSTVQAPPNSGVDLSSTTGTGASGTNALGANVTASFVGAKSGENNGMLYTFDIQGSSASDATLLLKNSLGEVVGQANNIDLTALNGVADAKIDVNFAGIGTLTFTTSDNLVDISNDAAGLQEWKNEFAGDQLYFTEVGASPVSAAAVPGYVELTIGSETVHVGLGETSAVFKESGITLQFDAITDLDINTPAPAKFGNGDIVIQTNAGKSMTIQTGANEGDDLNINIDAMNTGKLGITFSSIATQKDASKAITEVNDALNMVSTQRAALGALSNRLDHKIANLDTSAENLQAAESRIRDVDMAKEMTNFTKNNILAQASTAMLAQANALPQGVLQLLG